MQVVIYQEFTTTGRVGRWGQVASLCVVSTCG
jgi:hypothetical protein